MFADGRCISIPDSVTILPNYAFCRWGGPFTIRANKIEKIDKCCFYFSGLKEMYVPDTTKYIGSRAFDCFFDIISIPASIEYIEPYSFKFEKNTTVEIRGQPVRFNYQFPKGVKIRMVSPGSNITHNDDPDRTADQVKKKKKGLFSRFRN